MCFTIPCNQVFINKLYIIISVSTCQDAEQNLVVPVTYTIGGSTVLNRIPPSLSSDVTTGFMQFRAKAADGTKYAFCPAVK